MKQTKAINKLNEARDLKDIFDLVREVVMDTFAIKRSKLIIAAGDIETNEQYVLGGFFSPRDNAIVINKKILGSIKKINPEIFKSYLFHILLHEYLHSVGFIDENEVRKIAFLISNKNFGFNHEATKIALNPGNYIKNLVTYNENEFYNNQRNIIKNQEENEDESITNYIG